MVAFMSAVDLAFLTFAVVALEDSMTCMQKWQKTHKNYEEHKKYSIHKIFGNICRNSFDEGPGNMNPWPHTWCPLHHGVQQPQSSFQERATPNFDLLFLLVRWSWRDFALQLGCLDFQALLCQAKVVGESKPCRSLCQGRIQSVITLDQKFVGIKALHRPFNG